MRRALVIIGLLAVVVLAVGVIGPRLLSRPIEEPDTAALGEAAAGAEEALITGRGVAVPVRWARLSFPVAGQLEELKTTLGVTVTAGQVLAMLKPEELELQVRLAESDLQVQNANLRQLQQGQSQTEVAAAKAGYEAAQAGYEELRAGPSAAQLAVAQADLKMAELALQRAQAAYDAVKARADIGARPESMELERATLDYQRAKASYDLAVAGPSHAELKQAESQVAEAKARLEALTSADSSSLQAAEAAEARAAAELAGAELRLAQAVLRAPFDGTVTSVADLRSGDMVAPGGIVLTVADLSELQIEVTDLDEWAAANVKASQTVDLIVPALGNRSLRGRVVSVSNEPTVQASGSVFYRAVVNLDQQDPELRWGYTVRVRLYVVGAKGIGFR
jgi:HlyD family secretion protein